MRRGRSNEHSRTPVGMAGDGVDRRGFLRAAGVGGAAVVAGSGLLAACGGGGSRTATGAETTGGGGTPVRGGTLRVGIIGGGTAETLNPGLAVALVDLVRTYQLYNGLFELSDDRSGFGRPALAESAESNADASVWTFKLRDGVTWHDGKPFTADDVVYTMKTWSSPKSFAHGQVAGLVDFKGVRKRGRLEVEVPLVTPAAQFPTLMVMYNCYITQDGAKDFTKPVGTGPFKFESFTPGRESVFVANREYFEQGKPYLDKLVIDSSFTDDTARTNALLSGAIQAMPFMPWLTAKRPNGQFRVARSPSTNPWYFAMRVDKGPFADPRVRQALRLLVDRQALIDGALAGFGTVGDDLICRDTTYYADSLKRTQDIEKAKSLLKAAGKQDLAFAIPTADAYPGFVSAATLFAQQAKAIGLRPTVQKVPTADYFSPAAGYLQRSMQQDNAASFPSLTVGYRFFFTSSATIPETHWGTPPRDKLIATAMAATDEAKAKDLWMQVQQQQFDEGGQIVYAQADYVDGLADAVQGFVPKSTWNMNNCRFQDVWLKG